MSATPERTPGYDGADGEWDEYPLDVKFVGLESGSSSKAKAEKNQAMEPSTSENSCQLCALGKITFEPPSINCGPCGGCIKRDAMYYTTFAGDTRHYFCIPCYNEACGDIIAVDGAAIPKAKLEKKKNDEEIEEWWIQCDKCEAWQHQVCALFNGRRDDGGQATYTCPKCYIQEVERGECNPLPQSAVLGAKDLPRTILSDHIEQRLFRKLKRERQERARIEGKSYDEVPGVEAPIVRVVSTIDKKLAVKQQFFEIFREENYPTEFPYKSKVILSFQKIEGVEVCIFAMYVQEFGSECAFPNQRCIYLSYLDSVKYFRPDIEAVTCQALSTFVYHEILIGYLEYCKKRGFTSCYMWACPPLKGEDNILHHLPEIQRMPKSDELRKWYLSMLRNAAMEGIVVDITNLYDHFFSSSECKAKITASKLPYFDGDYWPRVVEDLINQMHQEEDAKKQKGITKESITERALKACGQSGLSANASKDLLLMHKIGEIICPMKEDFILVHLQHVCTYCRLPIVSGEVCWVCFQCENFQFCYSCYKAELKREERERHHVLVNSQEKHTFFVDKITDIPSDTKDKDKTLESEFFDTRQAFLSLCQGNRYQFDTLRRAKHSTMMVLYHLHNPTTLSFVTRCNMCHLDIKTDQGWLCELCPDYDVCNSCYQKNGGIDHPHELTSHPSLADHDAANNKAREISVLQTEAKAEKNLAMEHSMSDNSCQLCAVGKLIFEPPPVNCGPCGGCIKRDAIYYTTFTGDTRYYFCIPCYNEACGDTIAVDGVVIPKAKLEKKKNDEETEERWVQCDKCGAWQHQICALFNGRRNDGGQAAYTCPKCYIQKVERGECNPLPQSAVLGAKDLPRTILSDYIEKRLFWKLKEERQGRARIERKSYNEVLGVETPIIRVVSSVDKKLEVRQRFFEIFQEENYPTEFSYKSKVILSFQNIEGVEICIFCMYVQEFGSECQFPNQRCVCLSYLDSVKYFSPEIEAVTGQPLSTFVYHEILLGYLEHCKKRGFTSFYIRVCPPLKDEDSILHCLPEIQRMPKPNELREWYISMLRNAVTESIVVDVTNLYDHFFVSNGECKAKVTAAILPYFDGDYWPSAAEDLIYQMHQEKDSKKQNEKRTTRSITKRTLQACGQSGLSTNASKDLLLMHKLGEAICPMKEDFILVHLQHACTYCRLPIVSGIRWVCIQCKNFQFCDRCYAAERKREERERHHFLVNSVKRRKRSWENHTFCAVEITDVPSDTKDKDKIVECKFFDTRQAFLSLCQGNHYQFDTLRRAKHSSMMVLYHLHNPTAPAYVTRCNICQLDIKTGQGLLCTDYDVCNGCHHPHQLTNHPSITARDAQNKEARQIRLSQPRKMLDVLVHASQCLSAFCQYPNCFKIKRLFCHGIQCKTHAFGGCVFCKKMWCLLRLHARACNESECHVPQCRCLKECLKRLEHLSDSRRKAVVMEMTRQRVAELSAMVVD